MSRRARSVSPMRSSMWLRYATAAVRWPALNFIAWYTRRHQFGGGVSITGAAPPGSIFTALQYWRAIATRLHTELHTQLAHLKSGFGCSACPLEQALGRE